MDKDRITQIYIDDSAAISRTPEVEYEYTTAVADLLERNSFCLSGGEGLYELNLRIVENRLIMDVKTSGKNKTHKVSLPITPFRSIVRDYFFICSSYYKAIKGSKPSKIETIDMARRSLHNEGSELLAELLKPDIVVDLDTARGLFTLLCVLHIR